MKEGSGLKIGIWGLALAALAIVVPIVWDWWKQSSGMAVEVSSSSLLFSVQNPVGGLDVVYQGKKVDHLSQVVLRVRNVGRSPISRDDVVSPLLIDFDGEIFEARVVESSPSNLSPVLVDRGQGRIEAGFPLMNPGDSFVVSVLTPQKSPKVTASARIKNISEISVLASQKKSDFRRIDSLISSVSVGLIAALSFAMASVSFFLWIRKRSFVSRLRAASANVLSCNDAYEAIATLKHGGELSFLGAPAQKELRAIFLEKVDWPISDSYRGAVAEEIGRVVKSNSILPAVVVFSVFSVLSAYYFASKYGFGLF